MTDETDDLERELEAIRQILTALSSLDADGQARAIQYVFKRLKIAAPEVKPASAIPAFATPRTVEQFVDQGSSAVHTSDIRSFAESKQPRSANEMAAVVAYFLQYEAGEDERKGSITADDIAKYFHLAKQPKPANPSMTLTHSKNAGYLDQEERGQYKLNAVGYNLVAHKLPAGTSGSSAPKARKAKRLTPKKAAKKAVAAKRAAKTKEKIR